MAQHPLVLYAGGAEKGVALAQVMEAQGGYVYLPATVKEALAMYILYQPDVIILDPAADPDTVEAICLHLRSVDADPILLIGREIDPTAAAPDIAALIRHILYQRQQIYLGQLADPIPAR